MSLEYKQDTLSIIDFNSLYTSYRDKFTLIAMSYLQDQALAEDIVNESFMSFWESRNNLPLENLPAYILGIIKHKCIDALRQRSSKENREKHIYEQTCNKIKIKILEDTESASLLFSKEIETIFRRELENMPDLTSKVFILSRLDNKTYKEISAQLGIPVRKVTAEIQKALAILRISLKEYLPIIGSILFI